MLQPDSVGTALVFSKMLKVQGAERYGLAEGLLEGFFQTN